MEFTYIPNIFGLAKPKDVEHFTIKVQSLFLV